ncbi:hypothetical protein TNCV_880461 [Trichonephila clavipes]|nr:hypothetical protein TNCV_880461 [Trichonephila clavipes]
MWNAHIRTIWSMICPLTSSSIYTASCPSFSDKTPCNPFFCSRHQGKPIELFIATIPNDGSDPQVITVNHAGLTSTPHEMRSTNMNVWFTPRYPSPLPTVLREGQVEPDGPRRLHGGQRNRTTKNFPRAGSHVPGDTAGIQ